MISWENEKEKVTTLSSTEVDAITATETTGKIMEIQNIISQFYKESYIPTLYCDSHPTIAITNTGVIIVKTNTINFKYKFLFLCGTRKISTNLRTILKKCCKFISKMFTTLMLQYSAKIDLKYDLSAELHSDFFMNYKFRSEEQVQFRVGHSFDTVHIALLGATKPLQITNSLISRR